MSCGAYLVHLILTDALNVLCQSLDTNDIVGLICDGVQIVIHLSRPPPH